MDIKEKVDKIRSLSKKHSITAYEIGENTELTTPGIHRILTKQVIKPREKTLDTILNYIECKVYGTSNNKVEESGSDYNSSFLVGKHKVTLDQFMIAFSKNREAIIKHPIFEMHLEAIQEKMKREYLEDLQERSREGGG